MLRSGGAGHCTVGWLAKWDDGVASKEEVGGGSLAQPRSCFLPAPAIAKAANCALQSHNRFKFRYKYRCRCSYKYRYKYGYKYGYKYR